MTICKLSTKDYKKRQAPPHAAIQTEVIKMIVDKEGVNYPQAMKRLKSYVACALGKPYEKRDNITWMDALKKTKNYIDKGGKIPPQIKKPNYTNKIISKVRNNKLSYEELLKKNQQLELENIMLKNQLALFKIRIFDSL